MSMSVNVKEVFFPQPLLSKAITCIAKTAALTRLKNNILLD